jgi:hypothetical protein
MSKQTRSELQTKLKKADPIVRQYVAELEKRNAQRQREIVKLELDKVEQDAKIKALQKEAKARAPTFNVNIVRPSDKGKEAG